MDRAAAAETIIRTISQLFFSTEMQRRFHGVADALEVPPPTLRCLLDLQPGEARTMRSLADEWQCDPSFVTVTVDGLEERDLAVRRVAEHDRRVKTVELTDEGVAVRDEAIATIFAPLTGFGALEPDELITLARLLERVAEAQATHDARLLDDPAIKTFARRLAAHRQREVRHRGHADDRRATGDWRAQLEAQRAEMFAELRALRDELDRVRAEVQNREMDPVEGARLAKAEVKAAKQRIARQAKVARAEVEAAARRVAGAGPGASGRHDDDPR